MKGHKLRVLNLDDNLISSVSELESLAALTNLHELTFRSKQTDNPICRSAKYFNVIVSVLPRLDILDGVPLIKEKKGVASSAEKARREEPQQPVKENENENPNDRKAAAAIQQQILHKNAQEELKQILLGVIYLFGICNSFNNTLGRRKSKEIYGQT